MNRNQKELLQLISNTEQQWPDRAIGELIPESVNRDCVAEMLDDYTSALETGEMDGAGRYTPADVRDQADRVLTAVRQGGLPVKAQHAEPGTQAPGRVPEGWRQSLQEMVDAMRRYEMDAEGEAPARHRDMMRRAETLLAVPQPAPHPDWAPCSERLPGTQRPVIAAGAQGEATGGFDLIRHLYRQQAFSEKAFGPGARTAGVLDHIQKEIGEVRKNPGDVTEWIDIVLLALDGAWRSGHSPEEIAEALDAKQSKNESRKWPDWRQSSPDKAIEHLSDDDHPLIGKVLRYGGGSTALFRATKTQLIVEGHGNHSYLLYGEHIMGGIVSRPERDVHIANDQDLQLWSQEKGLAPGGVQ